MPAVQETIEQVKAIDVDKYKYGFTTEIETELAPKGAERRTSSASSLQRRNEPEWMLEWRLDAYRRWRTMEEPDWARVNTLRSTFRTSTTTPRRKTTVRTQESLDEVDPDPAGNIREARHSAAKSKNCWPACARKMKARTAW